MKDKYKIIIGIVVFIIATAIFSDWDHFKAGLMGKPAVEVEDTKN